MSAQPVECLHPTSSGWAWCGDAPRPHHIDAGTARTPEVVEFDPQHLTVGERAELLDLMRTLERVGQVHFERRIYPVAPEVSIAAYREPDTVTIPDQIETREVWRVVVLARVPIITRMRDPEPETPTSGEEFGAGAFGGIRFDPAKFDTSGLARYYYGLTIRTDPGPIITPNL